MLQTLKNSPNIKHRQIVKGYFDSRDNYHKIWWLLVRTRRLLISARADELEEFDITPPEAGVLRAIKSIGYKSTPMIISRYLLKQPHTTAGLLERMEKKGLIQKSKDLDSKNQIRIELTEKGEAGFEHTKKEQAIKEILSTLDDEELEVFKTCLEKIFSKSFEQMKLKDKILT